jgi:membrane peptidoglycan carboxypeptidase
VVEVGTARSAQIEVLPVAGKTGTARKTDEHGYVRGRYTSSFAGFFPAAEAKYVVFIRVDEPVGAFYGGTVAAPVFREAMEGILLTEAMDQSPALIGRLRSPERVVWTVSDGFADLPPFPADTTDAFVGEARWTPVLEPQGALSPRRGPEASQWVDVAAGGRSHAAPYDPRTQVKVPDFGGLSLREAVNHASRLGLRLAFSGTGRVVGQEPEPGEVVPRDGVVRVRNP